MPLGKIEEVEHLGSAQCISLRRTNEAGTGYRLNYEMVYRRDLDAAGGPGLRAQPAGLRDVRTAGHHAQQPLARPALDQSLSAERECNRYSANVGDTVAVVITLKNAGRLPVAWVLIEDLLPRRGLAISRRA